MNRYSGRGAAGATAAARRIVPAGLILLAACVHVPRMTDLGAKVQAGLDAVKAAEALEASKPADARKRYEAALAKGQVYKPLADYQRQLSAEISQVGAAGHTTFTPDSALGVPHLYDRAVETGARARLGLARLALARGDAEAAEKEARRALESVGKRAISPVMMASQQLAAHELLRKTAAARGKPGREKLSRLSAELLSDYLASPGAEKDRAQTAKMEGEGLARMKEIESFTEKVNSARTTQFLAAMNQAAGAMSSALGQIQQSQIDGALAKSGGRVTPEIRMMQQNKAVMDFQRQMLSLNPDYARGSQLGSAFLSPFANLGVGQQLVDPAYGARAPELIKEFAGAVAVMTGREDLKKAATALEGSVDAVVAARSGEPEGVAKALDGLARSFAAVQGGLESAEAAVAAPKP